MSASSGCTGCALGELKAVGALSFEIRQAIEEIAIPDEVEVAVTRALAELGNPEHDAHAVRSSATAEDLPTASFAGQQDSYLNVVGPAAVLDGVKRCWASLFTDRAVVYRQRNGFDHRTTRMAVVVQRMVFPNAAGILFTADPATGNRTLSSVEATFGLGETLVSGRVNPDVFKVRDGAIVTKAVATKQLAAVASPSGGTEDAAIESERQREPALTEAQVLRLADLGRHIEAHFGQPQDIEWCIDDDGIQIVQSRPITALFPLPVQSDGENHVYVSVGHQQMMTDPMKPLGLSVWQLTTPRPMAEAGGRLFVDVSRLLASPNTRAYYLEAFGRSDPLIGDALQQVLDRGDFIPTLVNDDPTFTPIGGGAAPLATDPAIVAELIAHSQGSLAALHRDIGTKSGLELLDFITTDIGELRRILFDPRSHQVFTSAMDASWWINEHMLEWLDEKNAVDILTQSVPNNVTSEMGLALLDVADAIRPHPAVVAFLEHVVDDDFLDQLPSLEGGREARDAVVAYLDKYGMRCIGEIDITRPRWSEQPTALVPMILSNAQNFEPGAGKRRFEEGRREAEAKERELLERLRGLPDGAAKAEETKAMIDRVRTFIGYREYPKYHMVSRYFAYKRALLHDAERLVRAGVLRDPEDIFFLRFEEWRDVVRTSQVDDQLVGLRKDAFRSHQGLTPPRVLTSKGEVVNGAYRREGIPADALVGLPVSSGTVEGRARVIVDVAEADLEPGDILVTAFTDPSWTPAFVTITGLVTEVGGFMTHGAVIAREYGLPAVVGVEHATQLIRDGQRIRVHGGDGYVEILSDAATSLG